MFLINLTDTFSETEVLLFTEEVKLISNVSPSLTTSQSHKPDVIGVIEPYKVIDVVFWLGGNEMFRTNLDTLDCMKIEIVKTHKNRQ